MRNINLVEEAKELAKNMQFKDAFYNYWSNNLNKVIEDEEFLFIMKYIMPLWDNFIKQSEEIEELSTEESK